MCIYWLHHSWLSVSLCIGWNRSRRELSRHPFKPQTNGTAILWKLEGWCSLLGRLVTSKTSLLITCKISTCHTSDTKCTILVVSCGFILLVCMIAAKAGLLCRATMKQLLGKAQMMLPHSFITMNILYLHSDEISPSFSIFSALGKLVCFRIVVIAFPIRGHSYILNDREFRKVNIKKDRVYLPDDLDKGDKESRRTQPFKLCLLSSHMFLAFRSTSLISSEKCTPLPLSKGWGFEMLVPWDTAPCLREELWVKYFFSDNEQL